MAWRLARRGQNSSTWEQKRAESWAEHRSRALQERFTIGERFNVLAKTPCCSFILRPACVAKCVSRNTLQTMRFLFFISPGVHMQLFISFFSWKVSSGLKPDTAGALQSLQSSWTTKKCLWGQRFPEFPEDKGVSCLCLVKAQGRYV